MSATIDGKNLNPVIDDQPSKKTEAIERERLKREIEMLNDGCSDGEEIDSYEIFDMLRHINDPEHPLTLEKLRVIKPELISVDHESNYIKVEFTPTIPNCSMATLIGLMIRVKLHRSLPTRYKIDVFIEKGKHETEDDINKQLNDKERVLAALENANLSNMVNKGLYKAERDFDKYLQEFGITD